MNTPLAEAMQPMPYIIQKFERETHDTFTLELKAAGDVSPWVFAPGQFIGWSPLRSLLPLIFFSFRRTRWALHKPLNCRGC